MPLVHVEPGDSEDEELVTVVEKEKLDIEKKVLTVQDKFRTVEKVLMVENLEDFLLQGWKLIFIISVDRHSIVVNVGRSDGWMDGW